MYRIGKEEVQAVARVIESKNLFKVNEELRETEQAQAEIERLFDTKHALIMTSGKAALISALIGFGIGPGDQVIVPAYTYIATAIAVTSVGAIPVIAEVDDSLTLDPVDVERKITPATKAIIPVHIQGFPCNMDALCDIAEKYGLKILEDACQADGGRYHGKRLGTIGHAGALSFNQFKLITTGEGGALLTDDNTVFSRALIYHDSSAIAYFGNQLDGITEEQFCGSEFRTNEITSAILRVQLSRMDGIIADLKRIKNHIMNQLKGQYHFVPSNDQEGDLGTTLAFRFESEKEAREFGERTGGYLPIDTGKHVYSNWTAIMNKRGAFHPLMDPFKMEANKDILQDYSPDMCPKTLDLLSRTVYFMLSPDMTEQDSDNFITKLKKR